MVLYRLIKWLANIAYFPILVVLYYVFRAIKGIFNKQKWTFSEWIEEIGREIDGLAGKWTKILIIASSIALLLTDSTIHQLVGIKNLKILPEGTYCFYVEHKNLQDIFLFLKVRLNLSEYRLYKFCTFLILHS